MQTTDPRRTGAEEDRGDTPTESEIVGFFQASLEMLCIAGGDGYFKQVNPVFERTLGYTAEELVSRPFIEFVHPEDQERTRQELSRLVAGIPTIHFENRYRRRDGTYCWISWKAMPYRGGQRIYAVASDVTCQKQIEADLRAGQERYRQLLETVTSYTYSVEIRGGGPASTSHSAGCVAVTGYSPADFAADPYLWVAMVHPDDRELVRRHAAGVLADAATGPLEHRILHRDGSVRWVRHRVVSHQNGQGLLARYDGVIEDITERKLSEERFRLLVESTPDAMVVVNGGGQIVLVNAQAEKLFGYAREEMLGQTVEFLVPQAAREQHVQNRAAYAAQRQSRMMGMHPALSGLRKDGSQFPAEIALSPIGEGPGMLIYAAIRDLTQRKLAEKALREHEAQLLAAREIQEHLLPECPPALPGFDIAGATYPAEFAAGDHYDFLPMRNDCLGLVIGDVAGHGIGPAILMASTHAHLNSLAESCSEVDMILGRANGRLIKETIPERFVTMCFARLDPRRRTLVYASAGHPDGYVLDGLGAVKARLPSTALPLGVDADAQFPTGETIVLQPDDMVLLFTDGLIEAACPQGNAFGCERVIQVACRDREKSAGDIIRALYAAVTEFTGRTTLDDDVTMVVIKVVAEG